jgi:3-oxoacyl-[acyl-carrier protein] reductase
LTDGYSASADAAHRLAHELSLAGVRAIALGADLLDATAPAWLVSQAKDALGPIDVLVANHGIAQPAAVQEVDAEDFDRTLHRRPGGSPLRRVQGGLARADLPSRRALRRRWGHGQRDRPRLIDTPMLPGDRAALAARIPVGRLGRSDEVADLTLAALRNGYLTGHVLALDGGMHPG